MRLLKDSTNYTKYTALGYLSLLMWATAALFTTHVLRLPTFEILSITFLVSFLLTATKLTITQTWHKIKQPWVIWLIGIMGTYGNDLLYVAAFKNAPPVQADLLNYLWPIMVILFAGFLPREKFTVKHILAATLGFAGAYILVTGGHGINGFASQYSAGYILAIFDAIVWSIYTLLSRHYGSTPVEMIGMYCGVGAVLSLITHGTVETWTTPNMGELITMVIMGLTTQGAAYFLWDTGIKKGNFKMLSILAYGNPILSVALLIAFGQAAFTYSIGISCVFVVAGAFIGGVNWTPLLTKVSNFMSTLYESIPKAVEQKT